MSNSYEEHLLSHRAPHSSDFEKIYSKIEEKIINNKSNPAEKDKNLKTLARFKKSELGRFLIENNGFNGYWTEYICSYPETKSKEYNSQISENEQYLLDNIIAVRSTQERYQVFKAEIKKGLKNNIQIASLPCGLMNDVLSQNFEGIKNFKLIGIDLDEACLEQAKAIALSKGLVYNTEFTKQDAWSISYQNQFDIFISNGLNLYVDDDSKVTNLYERIYNSLKPNGVLLTSTLSPSPEMSNESDWILKNISDEGKKLNNFLSEYVITFSKNQFRSVKHICQILEKCGYRDFDVNLGTYGIFPAIIAKK